ncbi:hypothetical protein EHR08_00815 [Leptospira bandrabouensis]|uniref:Uncharacterized protein n=1 Tax=Leptospira bandrabouensis TaxID=2484903 RepID=A0A6H3NVD4_9LEPT|nr:hypothetical protein EHR07_07900 [Leptospira bandrabouensis]TGN14880.1 hypothetical protein EHR08_00815 [Leptospira bandrabouensis]
MRTPFFAVDGTYFQTFVRNKFSRKEIPTENDLPSEPMILNLCESSLTFFQFQEKNENAVGLVQISGR